jgi:hypothetical protein
VEGAAGRARSRGRLHAPLVAVLLLLGGELSAW